MVALLEGPRIAPKTGGPARQLVVFIHGYGADGHDLIGIGHAWQPVLPDAAFVAPDAPEPCGDMGRQWFTLTVRDMQERWAGVNAAAPALEAFLQAELERHALAPAALAVVGFSQGAMMALHVGLRRAVAPAAVVSYSGILVHPPGAPTAAMAAEIRARPPVMLRHGDQDDVIPPRALFAAAKGLEALQVPVEWQLSPGVGHAIDEDSLRHGGEFLARRFQTLFGRVSA
ncbi:MAG: dienelactone hydrolase family protein [Variibacter sp.]|nr:dienelactone hydrolase family protein [Variibacter sp.]